MKCFSCDDLQRLSEEELKKHYLEVRSRINKNKRMYLSSKEFEMYLCYIIRELQNRTNV